MCPLDFAAMTCRQRHRWSVTVATDVPGMPWTIVLTQHAPVATIRIRMALAALTTLKKEHHQVAHVLLGSAQDQAALLTFRVLLGRHAQSYHKMVAATLSWIASRVERER
jgi:hypothetical protein